RPQRGQGDRVSRAVPGCCDKDLARRQGRMPMLEPLNRAVRVVDVFVRGQQLRPFLAELRGPPAIRVEDKLPGAGWFGRHHESAVNPRLVAWPRLRSGRMGLSIPL